MNTESTISSDFIKSVEFGLKYWVTKTANSSDETIRQLDEVRLNLNRMVKLGLAFPHLYNTTAVVALQTCDLVERKGYWLEWIDILTHTITLVDANSLLQGQLYNRLGRLHAMNRDLPKAIELHLQAEAIADALEDAALLSQSRFNLCTDYRQLRQYDACEQYGLLALAELETRVSDYRLQAATYNELGLAAHYRGQIPLAEERFQTAVVLYRQLDVPTYVVRVLNNLIGLARTKKEYNDALSYYQEGSRYYHRLSSEFDKVVLEVAWGGTLFDLGKYSEAEDAFRQANSSYLQNSTHLYYRALVAQCLGNVLLKQQRYDDAANYLRESASLWEISNDGLMLANTLGTLGELYMGHGNSPTAVAYFDQAIRLLGQYPNDINATRLQAEFADFRQKLLN